MVSTARASTEGLKTMGSRTVLPRPRSSESLERLSQGLQKATLQCKPLQQIRSVVRKGPFVPENLRDVSRLELLLASKQGKQVCRPIDHCEESQRVNQAIKLAAQWTGVQRAVGFDGEKLPASISPGNAAFAIYRLGCLASFASKKRNSDLAASGLVPALLEVATADLQTLDASSVTLLLDGCARLGHRPPSDVLEQMAAAAERNVKTLESSQVSLVLWALETLKFLPKKSFLSAFDSAAGELAATMSPQAICLTLRGFQSAKHCPKTTTLTLLAEGLQRQLLLFKPSEIAACLEAFSMFGFQPAPAIVDAIKQLRGQPLHANESAGKRSLTGLKATPKPVDGSVVKRSKPADQVALKRMEAAEKLVRRASDELRQSLSTRGADWDAVRLG